MLICASACVSAGLVGGLVWESLKLQLRNLLGIVHIIA